MYIEMKKRHSTLCTLNYISALIYDSKYFAFFEVIIVEACYV